ncbi:hypothetical protein POSPLADRAFT_1056497 [Postia placenta MAD-698-R-SB12]|uniref:Uncharacterized protein n=1 Tax=Postia placenta MAD-698-R-SB12 TaxID=670580 RepID=A0A1X6N3E8_9APHY|nr:hypothetical protein POSPLADRAFT_1056497 [Postia placenta MAD-698-R-SB12]OSX63134.1 hypothetical protein POSPLADRAFT_1056497 [Postia placenta MAD-698-R-SB12]
MSRAAAPGWGVQAAVVGMTTGRESFVSPARCQTSSRSPAVRLRLTRPLSTTDAGLAIPRGSAYQSILRDGLGDGWGTPHTRDDVNEDRERVGPLPQLGRLGNASKW